MRCEICNKSMTTPVPDANGVIHWYCYDCEDEIESTLFELEDDDEWFMEDLEYLEDLEILEESDLSDDYDPYWYTDDL